MPTVRLLDAWLAIDPRLAILLAAAGAWGATRALVRRRGSESGTRGPTLFFLAAWDLNLLPTSICCWRSMPRRLRDTVSLREPKKLTSRPSTLRRFACTLVRCFFSSMSSFQSTSSWKGSPVFSRRILARRPL